MGPEKYPFVRSIGGVSLFDFQNFRPEEYAQNYPYSSWCEFVPCRPQHTSAIWIEIESSQIDDNFINGQELLLKWKSSGELYRKIMPMIECAHIGPINKTVFGEILIYEKSSNCFSMI